MAAEIIPGILSHNLEEYSIKLEMLEGANCKYAQIDIMDGQFVPNISVMPHEIMSINTNIKFEAHIMTFAPERYYSDLSVMGIDRIVIHREVYGDIYELEQAIDKAKDYFSSVTIAYNPDTELETIEKAGAIQIMGVNPGASGQIQVDGTDTRIAEASKLNPGKVIAVDGGVYEDNIGILQKAGASRFIISSHIFISSNVQSQIQHFIGLVSGGL